VQTDISKTLYKKACSLMPGGVNSPVRAFKSVKGNPLFIKQGEGCHIRDEDNNTFVDYCCSWGPLILGHAHPYVIKCVQEVVQKGLSFGTPNINEVYLAKQVLNYLDFCDRIRFVNSGTEAVMTAIRLARGYTGRDAIIKFDGCYHGHVDYLLVKAGSGLATFGTATSSGVTVNLARDVYVLPLNDKESFVKLMDEIGDKVAAVIIEPVPANAGLLLQSQDFLELLRNKTREYETCLIFDEVLSGFRTNSKFAFKHYNIIPDIITLGKVIGGGMPVGAISAPAEIMNLLAPDGPVYQAGTLSGNPVAMTAGKATLEVLELQDGYKTLESNTHFFHNAMRNMLRNHDYPVAYINQGSLFWLVFDTKKAPKSFNEIPKTSAEKYAEFHGELLEKSIYFAPSGFEIGFISTAHDQDILMQTVKTVESVLQKIYR